MSTKPPAHRLTPLAFLRSHTQARVGLGRTGGSQVTADLLEFQLAHARARDAVHMPFDTQGILDAGANLQLKTLLVHTQVLDRQTYLQRPDLGRHLSQGGQNTLASHAQQEIHGSQKIHGTHAGMCGPDVVIIVSDGLSAQAAHIQIPLVLEHLVPLLSAAGLSLGPLVCAPFARVALEDEVGHALKARLAVILLGERPGLQTPEGLGAYLVHKPVPGLTDAHRNCVSNIHAQGLKPDAAAHKIAWLINEALRMGTSGVGLKEAADTGTMSMLK